MVADGDRQRAEVGLQLALLVQIPKVCRGLDDLGGDEGRVAVAQQVEGVVAQHQGGGRLGAEDRKALARQVREEADVVLRDVAGGVRVAIRQRGHPGAELAGRDVDLDAVVVQDGDDGLGDEWVVVVGEHVHEVSDARPGRARLARPAALAG